MSFLFPLFLAGAAAAAVPILLHLLERHTEQRVRFSAVSLLKGAPVERTATRRLREWLLLALRVGALLLLAAAFARPFFGAAAATSARLTVVALDMSLSMSAPATVSRMRQLGADAIRQAPAGDDVAVVTFANRAEVIVRPTPDRAAAVSAADAATPGFESTAYADALAAAGELFRGRTGRIVVVTDLQASGWDAGGRAAVPESVRVELKDAGLPARNVAVESLRAEGDRVIASIRNSGDQARDVPVRMTADGRAAGQTAVSVAAHGAVDAVFTNARVPASPRAGAVLAVTVDDPGGIPGDDTRYAILGGQSPAEALVVTTSGDLDRDAWYVRHALARARGVSTAEVSAGQGGMPSDVGAVVVLSTHGLERRGRERLAAYVNGGGGLLVAAGPDVDADVIADVMGPGAMIEMGSGDPERVALQKAPRKAGALSLAPADVRHPVFRSFGDDVASLGLVQFRTVARVSGRTCQTIARFTSGDAAVLDCVAGNGRTIVVASDLNNHWNDFPVRASFVPFLDQAILYLSNSGRRGAEYLVGEAPAGTAAVPGVATVAAPGGSRRIVVNVDPRESAIDRMSPADFQASITRLKDVATRQVRADVAAQENRQHLWQYLLAAMVIALAAEGIVAGRMA